MMTKQELRVRDYFLDYTNFINENYTSFAGDWIRKSDDKIIGCAEVLEDFVKFKTSVSPKEWGVHRSHCCADHGCKYGDDDCPVVLGLIPQDQLCIDCQ